MENIVIEHAKLMNGPFKNFAGRESQYNKAGNRNFCVRFDDKSVVDKLIEDGWNVKILQPRDAEDQPSYYLQVAVGFAYNPPVIRMVTRNGLIDLDEETISQLDYAEIENVDLEIRPRTWEIPAGKGKVNTGVKAYLKTMYVTLREDPFAGKYQIDDCPFEV